MKLTLRKKILINLSLLIIIGLLLPSNSISAQYEYSQYCLKEYRDQFSIDKYYPEYSLNCSSGDEFRGNIDDPELYLLAGQKYVSGQTPVAINWELQPLTKYLFGIMSQFMINPIIVQYLFLVGIIFVTYLSIRRVSRTNYLLPFSISLLFFFADPLIKEQITYTYLDLSQAFFIFLYLYLFYIFIEEKNRLKELHVSLGLISLSKSFSVGIFVFIFSCIYLFFRNRREFSAFIKKSYLSIGTYLMGYAVFFTSHNFIDFLNLHLNIIKFYKSYVPEYPKAEVMRIIFTGKWRIWWDSKDLITSPHWSLVWPLSIVTSIGIWLRKRKSFNELILLNILWIFSSLIFLSLRLVFPRYILISIPSMIFVFSYALSKFIRISSKRT